MQPERDDPAMRAVAARALDLIGGGALVGLGSGRTASVFVRMLGARVRDGLSVTGVPASAEAAALAREAAIWRPNTSLRSSPSRARSRPAIREHTSRNLLWSASSRSRTLS